jgi:hypothetical protein
MLVVSIFQSKNIDWQVGLKNKIQAKQWLASVILVTWIVVQGQSGQELQETPSQAIQSGPVGACLSSSVHGKHK